MFLFSVTQIAARDTHPLRYPHFDLFQLGAVHLAVCGVNGVNLCSRDTASRDHAFPSGLLAYNSFENTSFMVDV